MSYQLISERLRMVELDDYSILQLGHLVRSRMSRTHDSVSVRNLSNSRLCMFKCQAMCRATDEHLPDYPEGLGTPVTWVDQGLRMSSQASQGSTPHGHGTKNP
jgi:hypothetical protein